jgi:diguanylate cyclase (GGDEF)-like protein
MSTVPTSRASRRQVIAIGPAPFEPDGIIQLAGSIFEALGSIATCTASRPVDAVLLSPQEHETLDDLVHSAQAVRRLDATVQIVLVSAQPLAPSVAGHFDAHLAPPIDEARLAAVLGGSPVPKTVSAPKPVDEAPPLHVQDTPTPSAPRPVVVAPPIHVQDTPPASTPMVPVHTPSTTGPGDTTPTLNRLGDTDLVEAMLHDARGVQPLALRLILQQTGWSDCHIDPEGQGAAIRFGNSEFGQLMSTGQDEAALRPWANWLARWLALDEAQRELRDMAFRDELTSAWNRRYLNSFLEEALEEAGKIRRQLTVLVFDIDDFKSYNDRFGHAAGDTILCSTVQLLNSVIREGDRVCRIGGDEFAVVFADLQAPRQPGTAHPDTVEAIARRFQERVCAMKFPELGLHAPGTLSISGGLASFPWDGHDGDTLVRMADERALASKRRGKNCLTLGPGARANWPNM